MHSTIAPHRQHMDTLIFENSKIIWNSKNNNYVLTQLGTCIYYLAKQSTNSHVLAVHGELAHLLILAINNPELHDVFNGKQI